MTSEQSSVVISSNTPIEQFVILAKSAHGAAAVSLIKQVLDAPGVYVFGELLEQPTIKMLADGTDACYYNLLALFAYGNCGDYQANKETLPALTSAQKRKLQQLTLVSLAAKYKRIPYNELQEQLGIADMRELEDLVIETIYAGIIEGNLDQQEKMFEVDFAISRDVKSDAVDSIIETLENWCKNCEVTLKNLEDEILKANSVKEEKEILKKDLKSKIDEIKASIKEESGSSAGAASPSTKKAIPSYLKVSKKQGREGLRGSRVGRD